MQLRSAQLRAAFLIAMAFVLGLSSICVFAQDGREVYTATVIASESVSGTGSGNIVIRIASRTTDIEKATLLNAFQKSETDGMALLNSMKKGSVLVQGQPDRTIHAVFARPHGDVFELIIIGDHLASALEEWRGVDVSKFPVAVMHLRLAADGSTLGGEAFPAVKLGVTPDGFVDAQMGGLNKVTMINVARQQ